ncbi:MAG: sugar phosphate isomerase/epimerase, partial [Flavobacteriaceae bacterium]|nr:sugar phosphate isomerase/epimerase [Flavobacteriaceae bacterium]
MNRRKFTQSTLVAGLGIATGPSLFAQSVAVAPHSFNLNYAPHLGMFKNMAGDDPIDQLNFMADQGFTAFEDNNMNTRPIALQEKMAATMRKRNLTMGVFVAYKDFRNPTLASGKADARQDFLDQIKTAVTVAKRVNAKWVTVVPGTVDLKLVEDYQTANVIESLKQASAILEPHGIVMVLEPLNWYRNHAGLFLKESPQAFQICRAVNSPSCKILFDIYHQQIQEGNLIPNIEKCWDEIAYFQIGDNPG